MASVSSPPHSPPRGSPTSPHSPYQQLADADHCFPPSSAQPILGSTRSRSGSRTYREVQEEERRERELQRQRTRSRERAAAEDALEGRKSNEHALDHGAGEMSMTELRAEMETLLSLRRRSMSQPTTVDPDLPPTLPPTSAPPPSAKRPQLTLTITPPPHELGPGGAPISPTAPTAAETGTLVRRRSSAAGRLPSEHPLPPVPSPPLHFPSAFPTATISTSTAPAPDPSAASPDTPYSSSPDFFWLPASLHPELAPQEFKAFIREQTRPEALARRSSLSVGGNRVSRRASLLRGEYKPRTDDGVGESENAGIKRTASDGGRTERRSVLNFEELTIKDLQRLEELAAKAEAEGTTTGEEEEGERLGRVLRRSLSLNPHRVAAAAAAAADFGPNLQPMAEETSDQLSDEAPIIVPPPGQILRRNARTKIRKGSIGGEAGRGGSRFGQRRSRSSTGDLRASTSSTTPSTTEEGELPAGDISFDESVESEETRLQAPRREPTLSSAEDDAATGPAPPSSDSQHVPQHIEIASPPPSQPLPHVLVDKPLEDEPLAMPEPVAAQHGPPVLAPPAVSDSSSSSTSTISPASPDYDWATHHLPPPAPAPVVPPPPSEPQYTVHPQHSLRSDIPPPQAVPVPLPERRDSVTSQASRPDSPKPSVKEKKSGWARLGLGSSDDKGKKKGKSKEDSKEPSGFLGGLFGRKRTEEHERPPPRPPSPPPEPRIPPPPPTASGVLLPNGKYANFYRLPIHVERAVYRLSHIKLANPRRPLYEQVLISNLMFWYLGLIQKPVTPPPAATPVPIPGMRNQNREQSASTELHSAPPSPGEASQRPPLAKEAPHKRVGLSKPKRTGAGGRTAETPMRTPSYEVQNQQLVEEQNQRYFQQQPYPPHSSSPPKPLFAPPLSSSASSEPRRTNERTSAPSVMYPSTAQNTPGGYGYLAVDDDDRPLVPSTPPHQQQPYRESYPPQRPVPLPTYTKSGSSFEVTSRAGGSPKRLSGGFADPHLLSSSPPSAQAHQRRQSAVSDKSFEDIYDAYAPGSPTSPQAPTIDLPPSFAASMGAPVPSEKPGAFLGFVAPRGSSLKAFGEVGGRPR